MNNPHPCMVPFQQLFGHALDPMWLMDNGELIDCNEAALHVLGYRAKAELLPTSVAMISPKEQADGRPSEPILTQFIDKARSEKPQRFDWLCQGSEAKAIWVEATLSKFHHELADETILTLHWRDITESRQAEEKMQFESMHDALTGLPNRRALEQELSRAIKRAEVNGRALAIGMIDLDGFKSVNDDLGHDAGDNLLKAYSGRMQRRMRRHDFLARLGGDEFVLLLNNLDPDNTLEELEVITERLKECTAQSFQPIVGKRIGIGMSMGVALFPKDGEDADGLLRLADHALLAIKAIKLERTKWWALADAISDPESEQLGSLEPYGKDASKLLTDAMPYVLDIQSQLSENENALQKKEEASENIISLCLTEREKEEFLHLQRSRFERLVSPDLNEQQHIQEGESLGKIHSLLGLDEFEMIAALDRFSSMLQPLIKALPWRFNARLAVTSIIQIRLVEELQANQMGRSMADKDALRSLSLLEALIPAWAENGNRPDALLQYLSEIASISAATLGRPAIKGGYITQFAQGSHLHELNALIEYGQGPAVRSDANVGVRARAWKTGRIEICLNLRGPESEDQSLGGMGLPRSIVAIPILDKFGYPSSVLTLYGNYPCQFNSAGAGFWLESLRHLATDLLEHRNTESDNRLTDWEHRQHIHTLLAKDKLHFNIQPLLDLKTGKVDKVEFLARMQDTTRVLSPAEFLPSFGPIELAMLFEESLRVGLEWLKKWSEEGLNDLSISLNLPIGVLLTQHFTKRLERSLKQAGISPKKIHLELLETEGDSSWANSRDGLVSELIELGVELVMDDLGSGYSSLSRLRTVPFHSVKIDQNLVKGAEKDPYKSVQFITALIQMAHVLGQSVVVEGLENLALLEMATFLGAESGQGYEIAKPMPPSEFMAWRKNWKWDIDPEWPSTPLGIIAASIKALTPEEVQAMLVAGGNSKT